MSSPTTPRKLEQVKWERGVTDGDIRQGYVAELVNVEVKKAGIIETRDGLTPSTFYVPSINTKYFRLNGDPSGDYPNGWNVFIGATTIYVHPFGYGESVPATELEIDEIDIDSIEVVIVGGTIYISSSDSSGSTGNVMAVAWIAYESRFTKPAYVEDGSDQDGVQSEFGKWTLLNLGLKPTLSIFNNSNNPGIQTDRINTFNNINSWIEDGNQSNGVALYVELGLNSISEINYTAGFTDSVAMEFYVVFVYSDGSMSSPSNPVTASIARDDAEFDVGYTVVVSKDMLQGVASVRVYRKILSASISVTGNHDLMMNALLYRKDNDDNTFAFPYDNQGNRIYSPAIADVANDSFVPSPGEIADGGKFFSDVGGTQLVATLSEIKHSVTDEVSAELSMSTTDGWLKYGNIEVYSPSHYYRSGKLELSLAGKRITTSWIEAAMSIKYDSCVKLTDRVATGLSEFDKLDALIVGSNVADGAEATTTGTFVKRVTSAGVRGVGEYGVSGLDNVTLLGYYSIGSFVSATASAYGDGGDAVANQVPATVDLEYAVAPSFAIFRDSNQSIVLPSLEAEFGGTDLSEIIDLKPKHIGAAGGRLFGLNVTVDGSLKPAELMYTEPGNLGTFVASNYISYGIRDDGVGVALSTLKSFVIAHHSNATYVFDIIGGNDLTWREVASYNGVDCISSKLTLTTPFGVFWCGKMNLYAFSGNSVDPVSDEINVRYRESVDMFKSLEYREDLKQLWLSCYDDSTNESFAFVLDLSTGAWHTHLFDELTGHYVNSLFTKGINVYINTINNDNPGLVNGFYMLDSYSPSTFHWGIDTGFSTMGVPEIIKKVRRVYVYAKRHVDYVEETDGYIEIMADGDESGSVSVADNIVDDDQIRQSASVRGYSCRIRVNILGGELFWRGIIDSLGISYKPKKLK